MKLPLGIAIISFATSLVLVYQPNLSDASTHLLDTTLKICLISVEKALNSPSKSDSRSDQKAQKKRKV